MGPCGSGREGLRFCTLSKHEKSCRIVADSTCRISNNFWRRCFPEAFDPYKELIFGSWHERRYSACSANGRCSVPHCRTSVSIIHVCCVDNLCLSCWPRYCHTCLCDAGDACCGKFIRIYRRKCIDVVLLSSLRGQAYVNLPGRFINRIVRYSVRFRSVEFSAIFLIAWCRYTPGVKC